MLLRSLWNASRIHLSVQNTEGCEVSSKNSAQPPGLTTLGPTSSAPPTPTLAALHSAFIAHPNPNLKCPVPVFANSIRVGGGDSRLHKITAAPGMFWTGYVRLSLCDTQRRGTDRRRNRALLHYRVRCCGEDDRNMARGRSRHTHLPSGASLGMVYCTQALKRRERIMMLTLTPTPTLTRRST